MKLKRLISCGLVGILTGVGILMNAKVSSAEDKSVTLNSDCLENFKSYAVYNDVKTGFDFEVNKGYKNSGIQLIIIKAAVRVVFIIKYHLEIYKPLKLLLEQ